MFEAWIPLKSLRDPAELIKMIRRKFWFIVLCLVASGFAEAGEWGDELWIIEDYSLLILHLYHLKMVIVQKDLLNWERMLLPLT